MARRKMYEDEVLKKSLADYWKEECRQDPRKVSYAGLARFMNERGINYDANALKHRKDVIDAVKRLRYGGLLEKDRPVPAVKEGSDEREEELRKQNKQLLELFVETFTMQLCTKLLIESGLIQKEDLPLNPDAAEQGIPKAGEPIFKNRFVRELAKHASLLENNEEWEDDTYGREED